MTIKYFLLLIFGVVFITTYPLLPQDVQPDQVTVAFSDPSQPGFIKINLVGGNITVTGYNGDKVIIEAKAMYAKISPEESKKSKGMQKLQYTATGLTVEEENNEITISAQSWKRPVEITVKAPHTTSLNLKTVNDGDILVEDIEGEIEANNINGGVQLLNVSGSVVAHALNEDLIVKFKKVDPDKPMSFTSLNGDVDITLPANTKANVTMKSDNGEIFSDFDINLKPSSTSRVEEDNRQKGGKYILKIDKNLYGTINGGGPEYVFKTFNGDVLIRRKE